MADITDDKQASSTTRIVGDDENTAAVVNTDGSVHTEIHGKTPSGADGTRRITGIDEGNSTSTPLGADATFTGDWFNVEGYSNLNIVVFSDQDSAVDGFIVDYSSDGVNVDDNEKHTITSVSGPSQKLFSFPLPTKYYRVRYTNGSTPQTEFRLQAKLHVERPKPSSHRISEVINGENDAELTKSVLTGKDANGLYKNVLVDENGNLQIIAADGSSVIPTLGNNLKYDDMNASTGGVARGTVVDPIDGWVKVYDSTTVDVDASGIMMGFILNLSAFNSTDPSKRWEVRLVISGIEVFGSSGIKSTDLISPSVYGFQDDPTKAAIEWNGFMVRGSVLRWEGPVNLPITYDSNGVQIYVRKFGGTQTFNAGLVTLTRG